VFIYIEYTQLTISQLSQTLMYPTLVQIIRRCLISPSWKPDQKSVQVIKIAPVKYLDTSSIALRSNGPISHRVRDNDRNRRKRIA